MERHAETEAAIDQLVAALRAHLEAVRAAEGAPDDEAVWAAYIALNNAAFAYDELLNEVHGEVTPFDLEPISDEPISDEDDALADTLVTMPVVAGDDDPHPRVISVRQRRDYRVPSVAALLQVAQLCRPLPAEGEPAEPVRTVGDAVLELLQSGDGSLGMLDVPELEPLDGVVVVAELDTALAADTVDAAPDQAFLVGADDAVLGRLHEPLPTPPAGGAGTG